MMPTTLNAIKAVLATDSSIAADEQTRLLAFLRQPNSSTENTSTAPRLVRRAEAASRLSCSVRLIDKLAANGQLRKCTLPGRTRSCGFRESDLILLLNGKAAR